MMKRLLLTLCLITVSGFAFGRGLLGEIYARRANAETDNGWTDPFASSLALRLWFDSADNKLVDSSSTADTYATNGAPVYVEIGTNDNGRIDHGYTLGAGKYLTGSATPVTACTSLTFCIWANISSYPNGYDVFISAAAGGNAVNLANNFGNLVLQFDNAGTYGFISGKPVAGGWQHIVFQWAAPNVYSCYLNATNATVGTIVGSMTNWNQTSVFRINGNASWAGPSGNYDDIRVYTNKFLSASEVTNLYRNTLKPNGSIENGGTVWP
jgi:hypothetical protein